MSLWNGVVQKVAKRKKKWNDVSGSSFNLIHSGSSVKVIHIQEGLYRWGNVYRIDKRRIVQAGLIQSFVNII
jgi:hypothetical protein